MNVDAVIERGVHPVVYYAPLVLYGGVDELIENSNAEVSEQEIFRWPSGHAFFRHFFVRPRHVLGAFFVPTFLVVESVAVSVNNGITVSDGLKAAGFLVEMSGLLTVAVGLYQTLRLFRPDEGEGKEEGGWWKNTALYRWFADIRRLFFKRYVNASMYGGAGAFGSAATALVTSPRTLTIEERVAALEAELKAVHHRFDEVERDTDRKIAEVRSEFGRRADDLTSNVKKLGKMVEDASIGGLHLEAMGLVWLFVGALLNTFPEWAARALWWRWFL